MEEVFRQTEKVHFSPPQIVGFVVVGVVMVAAVVSIVITTIEGIGSLWPIVVVSGLAFLLALAFGLSIYFTAIDDRNARRSIWQNDETVATLSDAGTDPSMRELLILNRQEMQAYHVLTKMQAKRSFANSLVAMWLGFLVVTACIVFVALPLPIDASAKVAIATVGTAGTIVSGFITRTFLRQHSLSIAQLNRFFDQPLVTSYLLHAERVASGLSEGAREKALADVVDRALDVTLLRSPGNSPKN